MVCRVFVRSLLKAVRFSEHRVESYGLDYGGVLGGSWAVISGVISPPIEL